MQLQVTEIRARTFDLDVMDLFWKIADFSEGNILDYDFYVLRSESPGGPFETLAGPFQDQYYFRDISPALLHKWRKLYYKLRIVSRLDDEISESGVTAQVPEPGLEALEIQRQEDLLFREFIGRRCWLFPIRTFGPRCICVDPVGGRRTRGGCLTCYDVGYLGGYLSPIGCFVQIDPNSDKTTLTPLAEQHNQDTSARLISFPPMKPKDVLIESENVRWRVVTVTSTQRLRAVVHQEIALHQIVPGDVEYRLPLKVDLQTLVTSSERNFENLQGPDQDEDLKKILAAYGGTRGLI